MALMPCIYSALPFWFRNRHIKADAMFLMNPMAFCSNDKFPFAFLHVPDNHEKLLRHVTSNWNIFKYKCSSIGEVSDSQSDW